MSPKDPRLLDGTSEGADVETKVLILTKDNKLKKRKRRRRKGKGKSCML